MTLDIRGITPHCPPAITVFSPGHNTLGSWKWKYLLKATDSDWVKGKIKQFSYTVRKSKCSGETFHINATIAKQTQKNATWKVWYITPKSMHMSQEEKRPRTFHTYHSQKEHTLRVHMIADLFHRETPWKHESINLMDQWRHGEQNGIERGTAEMREPNNPITDPAHRNKE